MHLEHCVLSASDQVLPVLDAVHSVLYTQPDDERSRLLARAAYRSSSRSRQRLVEVDVQTGEHGAASCVPGTRQRYIKSSLFGRCD